MLAYGVCIKKVLFQLPYLCVVKDVGLLLIGEVNLVTIDAHDGGETVIGLGCQVFIQTIDNQSAIAMMRGGAPSRIDATETDDHW